MILSEPQHRKLVKQRQTQSVFWQWVHRLGSLKSAVILILSIALACGVATIYESKFNTAVAQYYIYNNPLFALWLFFLCLNLICSAMTRWPWQRKHLGFVVTHGGIIILLIGAVLGRSLGWDASVTLKKGEEPTGLLVRKDTILYLQGAVSGEAYTTPLNVAVRVPSQDKPRFFKMPESELTLKVDGFSEKLVVVNRLVEDQQMGTQAGLALNLQSNMMGQTLTVSLLAAPKELSTYDLFGLARIELVDKLPEAAKSETNQAKTYRETHMVFERHPESPVTHNTGDKLSGYRFFLEKKMPEEAKSQGEPTWQIRARSPRNQEKVFALPDVVGKPFPGEEEGTQIQVVQVWRDLKMQGGKPTEASENWNNPAALVTLSGFLEAESKPPVLYLKRLEGGRVAFRVLRGDVLAKEGVLTKDTAVPLGWADWSAKLEASHDKARIVGQTEEQLGPPGPNQQAVSGLSVQLLDAQQQAGPKVWLASGTSRLLQIGEQTARVGFGLKTERLPFLISLENFQVPRDPGTETPANFISSVRFHDPDTGEKIPGHIEMNHPASYPGDWWRAWTGLTYKFSQAGWDPKNMDQTTLQVLHDPGWLAKWVGSLLICVGITLMFYWKEPKRIRDNPAT
ncbi:MAG: hypothetical protein HC904_04920 [Blastochloris sp.]|nr:hypothetical protein [Blastochloris sp.]